MWRDGQKKNVFVYRFLTTGTIEEKVGGLENFASDGFRTVDLSPAAEPHCCVAR